MPAFAPLSLGPGRGGKLGDVEGGCQKLLQRRGGGRRAEAACYSAPLSRHIPEECRVVHRVVRLHPAPVLHGFSSVGNMPE